MENRKEKIQYYGIKINILLEILVCCVFTTNFDRGDFRIIDKKKIQPRSVCC
jgi:hypothetical protein